MARVFARLLADGVTIGELIHERGDIAREFHPEFLHTHCVEITGLEPAPEIGWTYANGKFAVPPVWAPSPAQRMQAELAAGIEVASAAAPALDATYDATGPRWQAMRDEALYIASFGAFSGALAELDWMARSGEVVFKTPAEFQTVVRAIGDRITAWQRWCDGKGAEPAGPAAIA